MQDLLHVKWSGLIKLHKIKAVADIYVITLTSFQLYFTLIKYENQILFLKCC